MGTEGARVDCGEMKKGCGRGGKARERKGGTYMWFAKKEQCRTKKERP